MNGIVPLAVLHELFDQNYWARDRQLQACTALSEEQFARPLGGSFPSLRETLAHLLLAEWLWLERWEGRSPKALPSVQDFPTLTIITERWREVEREMRRYLAGLNEEALATTATYVSTRGNSWAYPRWRMILHLLHHQTYHRGQVTNMLRQLGVQPPKVDFLDGLDAKFRS